MFGTVKTYYVLSTGLGAADAMENETESSRDLDQNTFITKAPGALGVRGSRSQGTKL